MTKPAKKPRQISPSSTAVAACSLTLSVGKELQLLPAGIFKARDGRPFDAPHWFIDAALAQALIDAANARLNPYVIDYEHQTLLKNKNGLPAPAAGWFKALEWREGLGLFAIDVEWTERAKGFIEAGEYRFISPVLGYDKVTGNVTALFMAAITNDAAIDGMDEILAAVAALNFDFPPSITPPIEENNMEELLEQLRWLLNLPVGSTADDIKAHLEKLIGVIKEDATATAAASVDLGAMIKAQRATIVSLSTATPDPAKFVPVETMRQLQTQVVELTNKLNVGSLDETVRGALASGKLLPAQEAWARDLGAKNFAALTAFLDTAVPIAALGTMQTGGQPPQNTPPAGALTPNQVALCTAMGLPQDEFLKTLKNEAA